MGSNCKKAQEMPTYLCNALGELHDYLYTIYRFPQILVDGVCADTFDVSLGLRGRGSSPGAFNLVSTLLSAPSCQGEGQGMNRWFLGFHATFELCSRYM
jgi:hypothetical protein